MPKRILSGLLDLAEEAECGTLDAGMPGACGVLSGTEAAPRCGQSMDGCTATQDRNLRAQNTDASV